MSNKTLVRGLSAAAILAILSGAAYGELDEGLKATKSNGCETVNNVSAILGGTNICGGFAQFVPVLTRGENNSAATLGANGSSYGDGALFVTHQGDWSSLVAVKLSATENTVIWSTGRYHANGSSHVGLALIQKNSSTVALVKWDKNADPMITEIVSATIPDSKYHTILVTHKYTAAVEEPATVAQSVYTIYVDGTATEATTASGDAYTDLDDSGFQYGSVHGATPSGLNNTAGILMDEAGVWTSKCLTATEAATVAGEFVYSDMVTHTINLTEDKNWSAIKPETISEDDIIEIITANKTITFDEAASIPCPVIVRGGILRIVNPQNLTIAKTMTVIGGATLRIDHQNVPLATEISIADDLIIQGGLELTNVGSTAGTTRNHNKTDKRIIAQKIVFDGGSMSLDDGSVYFKGAISVPAGKTASMTTGWSKAWIFDSLTVPATSTLNFTNNISSDRNESILDVLGGEVAGTFNVTSKSSSTGTLAVFPTTACANATINLNGATLVGGETAETTLTLAGNVTATHVNNGANVAGTRGHITLNGSLRTYTDTTFTVGEGKLVVTKTTNGAQQNRGLGGAVVIAQNATLALQCNDAINYDTAQDKPTTLTINGTLEGGTNRQSFGDYNKIVLGAGATITGDGAHYSDENYDAVLDFFRDQTITIMSAGTVNLNGAIGVRTSRTLTIKRGEGVEGEIVANIGKQIAGSGAVTLEGINKLWDIPGKFMPTVGKKLTIKNSTGHFVNAAFDGTLTIDGSFTVVNGYSGVDKACTIKKLIGTSEASIVDGLHGNATATPVVYVQDWTEWNGTVVYPEENKQLTVNFSVAKIDTSYYYSMQDAITAATDDALDTITVIDPTAELPEGYEIVEGKIVKKSSPTPTVPDVIKGGSEAQQTAYAAWATANGVSGSTTEKLADAFAVLPDTTGCEDAEEVLEAAEDELVKILAKIDLTAITTEEFTLEAYPNATFQFVDAEVEGVDTDTTHLYRLQVTFKSLAEQD